MDSYALAGLASFILALVANAAYVIAILRGTTRPDRVSWWILAGLNIMIAASLFVLEATHTLWLPVGYAISFTIIALLSLKYGEGTMSLTRLQTICIVAALATAFFWWFTEDAFMALLLMILIDALGLTPTIYKSFVRPWYEDRTAWVITTLASICSLLAIDMWTFEIVAYPLYAFIGNVLIATFLLRVRSV